MCKTRLLLLAGCVVILIMNHVGGGGFFFINILKDILSRLKTVFFISYTVKATEEKKCPENEFYTDCGESCQSECATLNQPCRIQYIQCPSGCYCNEGYARNASGTCVQISDCVKNWSLFASRTY